MTLAFDTLKFAHRPEQAGVSRSQAETHAKLARDMIIADLARKVDLAAAVKEIKSEIASAVKDGKSELDGAVKEFKTELATSKSDLDAAIKDLKAEIATTRKNVKSDLDAGPAGVHEQAGGRFTGRD